MISSGPLLQKFPLHNVGGPDALSATIAPYIGENSIAAKGGAQEFQALINLRRLQKISLLYCAFEKPFNVTIPNSTSFLHGFPIRGNAEHFNNGFTIFDSPGAGAVGGPGPVKLSYGPQFETLALFVRPESLSGALSALVGAPAIAPLKLEKAEHASGAQTSALREIVRIMIREIDREESDPSPILLAELEQAALVAFLSGTSHNHSHLLHAPTRNSAPWQVRRIEDYIEANWDQPITVEALAALTNASARSIFHSFKQYRGYSPMNFAKQVRLKRAREMLATPGAGRSVTDVAFICGFGSLGHFANDYFRAFGEKPSATRSQSKGIGARAGRAS